MDGVIEYDERWVEWFEQVRAAIPGGFTVEHVGSTAVPGLAAKPIIDVDVVAASEKGVPVAVSALVQCGWRHEGDLGISGREAFRGREDLPAHHLYVVVAGSGPHLDHIDLRDHLRTHPTELGRYAELKRELAPLLETDRDAYFRGKSALIAEMLMTARMSTAQ